MIMTWKGQMPMEVRFRTRLKELMQQHQFDRMDIVRMADVSYPTVAKWETEDLRAVDAPTLTKLLNLFQVGYEDFIYTVNTEDKAKK